RASAANAATSARTGSYKSRAQEGAEAEEEEEAGAEDEEGTQRFGFAVNSVLVILHERAERPPRPAATHAASRCARTTASGSGKSATARSAPLSCASPRPSLRAARRTSSSRPPDPSRLRTLWRATPMAGAAVRPHPRGQVLPRPPPASPAPARSACAPATTAALTTSDAGGDGDVEGEGEEEEDDDDEADDDDEGDATTTTTTTAATTTREADGDDDGGGGDGNSGDGGGGDDGRRHAEAP
ncbi:unnamed protein product, partial [Prorocentrum cordatum]